MLETLDKLETRFREDARTVDKSIIKRRTHIVQANISQIEGLNRSTKHIQRLAGGTPNDPRKSRTEQWIEWFIATGGEHRDSALQMQAFLIPMFSELASNGQRQRDFWEVHEEMYGLLGMARTSFLVGDRIQARFTAVQMMAKAREMLVLADQV